ncbi:MAG TPA: VOC family protein [bacterium]|jgi:catechol 2,3-dioxygenase-like lactoylglutathione lyase family enzyme
MNEPFPRPELYTTILRVRNVEESVAWYRRVFDLSPEHYDARYRLAVLSGVKGQRITLREAAGGQAVTTSGLHSVYVVFMTPSADESHARLTEMGEKVSEVQDQPGVRLFWLYDPDGHPLCILQFVIDWGA